MLHELFVTKNKLLDKHESMRNALFTLTGDSIIFSKSDEKWREKRKVLSTIFYKQKTVKLMENIARETKNTFIDWRETYVEKGMPVNLPTIISQLMSRNIMVTIFGEDVSDK